jgi:anaerobic selenocysteine-containing dehydrogenase
VIDPRRTETAAMADVHLQVSPGTDAWCLAALLALVLKTTSPTAVDLDARQRVRRRRGALRGSRRGGYCVMRAGVPETQTCASRPAHRAASSVSIYEDLGIQQSPHSTLCSYLEKLVYLLVGSFAKRGGMNIHTRIARLSGGGGGLASVARP